mmetsp:Transcript_38679/g.81333  ORF Transcript_38679/g.81333 Transcript_38679/m.81333 type:complete len:320 (+) Transcript_38679:390-1349(+)
MIADSYRQKITAATILLLFISELIAYRLLVSPLALGQQEMTAVTPSQFQLGQQEMMNRTLPKCMVFLHIPKTGGRTVNFFLENLADRFMKFKRQGTSAKPSLNITDLEVNQTYTMGHFTTLLFEKQPSFRDCFKMTVLREPVDRAISAFFFHNHVSEEIGQCLNAGGNNDTNITATKEGVEGCKFQWQYSNDMTRRLAGFPDTEWNICRENKYWAARPNRTHLDHAKENLQKYFDAVCFLHELPLCVDKVLEAFRLDRMDIRLKSARLKLSLSRMTTNSNSKTKTKSRPYSLDDEAMEKFRNVNEHDIELYNWALSNVN